MAVHASLGDTVLQLDGALDVLLLEGASALAPEGELVIVALGPPSEVCLELVVRGLAGSVVCNTVAGRASWSLAVERAVLQRRRGAEAITTVFRTISIPVLILTVVFMLLLSFLVSLISIALQQRAEWDLVLFRMMACFLVTSKFFELNIPISAEIAPVTSS